MKKFTTNFLAGFSSFCLFLTTPASAFTKPTIPDSCQQVITPISCIDETGTARKGIFIRTGNDPVMPWTPSAPLAVPANSTVAVAVCDYNNTLYTNPTRLIDETESLLPQLVGNIGDFAGVSVNIENSANATIENKLILGEERFDTNGDPIAPAGDGEPALIDNLIRGDVGYGARIDVSVRNSANVTLASNSAVLHVGGGSLMEEVINAPANETGNEVIDQGCVNISVQNSANVYSDGNSPFGTMYIGGGQLENESVDYAIKNSFVSVQKTDMANVTAGEVKILQGELIDETLDTRTVPNSTVDIQFERSANVNATSVKIKDAELIDETVDSEAITGSEITLNFLDSANITASVNAAVEEGELIDEAIDTENISNAKVVVRFDNAANVNSPTLTVFEGELVDEVIDGEQGRYSTFEVHFKNSVNVIGTTLTVKEGELLDEVMDGEVFEHTTTQVTLSNTANANVDHLKITGGELIDEAVDVEDRFLSANFQLVFQNSANHTGKTLEITGGELVDEIIDATNGSSSTVNMTVMNVANFRTTWNTSGSSVLIQNGELMDELMDVGQTLFDFAGTINVYDSATVRADQVTLNNAQLIDEVVDLSSLVQGRMDIVIRDSVNLTSPQTTLINDSKLLDAVIDSGLPTDLTVNTSLVNSTKLNGIPTL